MTAKRYQILSHLPTSGPMYIPVNEGGKPRYSEGFAVRFFNNDGTEWVANFAQGWTSYNDVIEFKDTVLLLVIAGGKCYVMNPEDTKPLEVFGIGYCGIFKAEGGRYVLQDQTDFTVIEPDCSHWYTERISADGFKDIAVDKNMVTGLGYDSCNKMEEWFAFTYDLDARLASYKNEYYSNPWWRTQSSDQP